MKKTPLYFLLFQTPRFLIVINFRIEINQIFAPICTGSISPFEICAPNKPYPLRRDFRFGKNGQSSQETYIMVKKG